MYIITNLDLVLYIIIDILTEKDGKNTQNTLTSLSYNPNNEPFFTTPLSEEIFITI